MQAQRAAHPPTVARLPPEEPKQAVLAQRVAHSLWVAQLLEALAPLGAAWQQAVRLPQRAVLRAPSWQVQRPSVALRQRAARARSQAQVPSQARVQRAATQPLQVLAALAARLAAARLRLVLLPSAEVPLPEVTQPLATLRPVGKRSRELRVRLLQLALQMMGQPSKVVVAAVTWLGEIAQQAAG